MSSNIFNIQNTRFDAKISNLGRLFQILTDVFGQKNLQGLKKIEGQEVLLYFPKILYEHPAI